MSVSVAWLSESEIIERLKNRPRVQGPVFVYSSQLRGWTDHVLGGLVGIDDHGFHRGDGVFEAFRAVNKRPYLLRAHLDRMLRSAAKINLQMPEDFNQFESILAQGLERFASADTLMRLFVTRGPGGFSPSPRESLGPQLFLVITPFKPPPQEKYLNGVRIGRSKIQVKNSWLATTKSLNYLPNVLMKAESLERGLDFTVNFDEEGCLAESSTENIVVLRQDGVLCHPPLDKVLKGCTMSRFFDLAEQHQVIKVQREVHLTETDVLQAQGLFMVGTTLDVLPVSQYEGQKYQVHPLSRKFRQLVLDDQT
ncbi:MAG: aminotransferase class IV [Bdellovibrio sp.]